MRESMDVMQVDPEHYEVLFENDRVRALRIRFEPRARSRMHSHPESTLLPEDSSPERGSRSSTTPT